MKKATLIAMPLTLMLLTVSISAKATPWDNYVLAMQKYAATCYKIGVLNGKIERGMKHDQFNSPTLRHIVEDYRNSEFDCYGKFLDLSYNDIGLILVKTTEKKVMHCYLAGKKVDRIKQKIKVAIKNNENPSELEADIEFNRSFCTSI